VIVATADSNIYVSAFLTDGVARQFLNAARSGAFQLAISEPIIAEVRGVLWNKFQWSEDRLDEAVSALREFTQLVIPTKTLRIVMEDPDDDRIIECAIASHSQFIVSGDKDLLRLAQFQTVRILKLSEFMRLIPDPTV